MTPRQRIRRIQRWQAARNGLCSLVIDATSVWLPRRKSRTYRIHVGRANNLMVTELASRG